MTSATSHRPGLLDLALSMVERGLVPDALVRRGIRRLCAGRLREIGGGGETTARTFAEAMRRGPVAPVPEKANEQHYEVPAAFFEAVLGPHLKYSGCLWPDGVDDLGAAEAAALQATCERAGIEDGLDVLELGCGWGSLTRWMARRHPGARITAVSNSASQRRFIEGQAADEGLSNIRVITADMNDFDIEERFDRVVSVEMFEHMRNWGELLRRVRRWLRDDGRLFVHVFCHRTSPYRFETEGAGNWMGRHFFTGGIMPSEDLIDRFADDLRVVERWRWDGTHYQRTAEAWLANLDRRRERVMPLLRDVYGRKDAARWLRRWRIFFMACAELFGYEGGAQWGVAHYLLEPTPKAVGAGGVRTDAVPV